MKLSDYKGEEALEVLADIIEPAAEIFSDKEVVDGFKNPAKRLKAVSVALRKHKKPVIALLAALERKDPEEYEVGVLTLPAKLLEILNDKELLELFTSQAQTGDATSSASASESIEE